ELDLVIVWLVGRNGPAVFSLLDESPNRRRLLEGGGCEAQRDLIVGARLLAGVDGRFAGLSQNRADAALVGDDAVQAVADETPAAADTLLERGIGVRFAEDADAVAQAGVNDAVARQGRIGLPALAVPGEVAVKERINPVVLLQSLADIRQKLRACEV